MSRGAFAKVAHATECAWTTIRCSRTRWRVSIGDTAWPGKRRREGEMAAILSEFVGRLRAAFGSLAAVRGKRILDLASGSNSSRHPRTGRRTALFGPWFG